MRSEDVEKIRKAISKLAGRRPISAADDHRSDEFQRGWVVLSVDDHSKTFREEGGSRDLFELVRHRLSQLERNMPKVKRRFHRLTNSQIALRARCTCRAIVRSSDGNRRAKTVRASTHRLGGIHDGRRRYSSR